LSERHQADPAYRPHPADSFAAEGVALIRERSSVRPQVAVVIGSGLWEAVEPDLEADRELSFETLPGFPPRSVPGQAGRLVLGALRGVPAAVFLGRVHLYEGHQIGSTTLIPRLAAELGAPTMVVTNAAGALHPNFRRGQLMLIEDHINLLGVNPLSGWRYPDGMPAFVDLAAVYDRRLLEVGFDAARAQGIPVARGVYVALPGPSYETPAETEFLRRIGADAVGMSTVPEAVTAVALGMRVAGVSCITNVAGVPGTHEDVLAGAHEAAVGLRAVLSGILSEISG
jgi:purine-nucleoside phosphorylase